MSLYATGISFSDEQILMSQYFKEYNSYYNPKIGLFEMQVKQPIIGGSFFICLIFQRISFSDKQTLVPQYLRVPIRVNNSGRKLKGGGRT